MVSIGAPANEADKRLLSNIDLIDQKLNLLAAQEELNVHEEQMKGRPEPCESGGKT